MQIVNMTHYNAELCVFSANGDVLQWSRTAQRGRMAPALLAGSSVGATEPPVSAKHRKQCKVGFGVKVELSDSKMQSDTQRRWVVVGK